MSTLFSSNGWQIGTANEANDLLAGRHYLGPLRSGAKLTIVGYVDGEIVAAQMWKHPTSRRLPADGSWLELSRWCLTPEAGANAGSRMHRAAVRLIRSLLPRVTTLVSYSDPSHGHTGALYRACNWQWAPTWHRLRPPPTGHGDWASGQQAVKDRWIFPVCRDERRTEVLRVDDAAAVRHWQQNATEAELRWAKTSPSMSEHVQVRDGLPVEPLPVDRDAHSVHIGHRAADPVHLDSPALQGAEHVAGIGLVPGQSHGVTVLAASEIGGAA